jgi:hypothetical protein
MKRLTLFLLFIFTLTNTIFSQTTPKESEFFKSAGVSQITEIEFTEYNNKPSKTIKEFNEYGELIIETLKLWNPTDSIYELDITIYEYDSLSNVTRIFSKKNNLRTLWFTDLELFNYSYNSKSHITKVKEWSRDGESVHDTLILEYHYDSVGNKSSINRYRLDGYLLDMRKYSYNNLNQLIEEIWVLNSQDEYHSKISYRYDLKEKITIKTAYNSQKIEYINFLHFDKKKRLRKITDRNGSLKSLYKYNTKGLLKKSKYSNFYRTYDYIYF